MGDTRSERSRQFRRVSTKRQEQEKQLADLASWDAGHGYDAGTPYVVDGKSAYHGKQIPALERAVTDMESGQFDVLVFWKADRMWRGESLAKALAYVERIHNTGGRIEFVKDSHLNITPDSSVPAWVRNMLFAQAFGVANAESQNKSDRSKMDIAYHKEIGSVHGRAPWGMEIVGEKDHKSLVYTDEGRIWIPLIFQAVIDGKSCREIAMWLDAEGIKPMNGGKWNEYTICNRIIKNKTYMGKRPNAGNLEVEAIVTATIWKQANESLTARYRPGRSTTKKEKALLKPICQVCYGQSREGCESGISPMYRLHSKYGVIGEADYYRCAGAGPQRKGCGAPMIPCQVLDAYVTMFVTQNTKPHTEPVFVAGDDRADEIESLRLSLDRAGSRQESNAIWDEIERLEAMPSVRPHWEDKETDTTEGDYFQGLDRLAQHKYLSELEILAKMDDKTPMFVIVGLADAEDYGLKTM